MPRENAISFLLDPELRAAFDAYKAATGTNTSQAARILFAIALKQEQTYDLVIRRASIREGVMLGVGAVKRRLGDVLTQALGDLEVHLG